MCERIDLKEFEPSEMLTDHMVHQQYTDVDRNYVIYWNYKDGVVVMDVDRDWHNPEECPFFDTKYSVLGEVMTLYNGKITQWYSDYPGEPRLITKKEVTK